MTSIPTLAMYALAGAQDDAARIIVLEAIADAAADAGEGMIADWAGETAAMLKASLTKQLDFDAMLRAAAAPPKPPGADHGTDGKAGHDGR